MIKVLIIDDEPSAVEVIRLNLQKRCAAEVEIVGTTNFPGEGKALVESLKPDLVFLDIEMPGLSGIELAGQIVHTGVRIIFVTAYDAYAVNAFKVNAIDYLLKPVDGADLVQAIYKVKKDMEEKVSGHLAQLASLEHLFKGNRDNRIGIGMAEKIQFVNTDDIVYCQANGAYTVVYLSDASKIVASKSLSDFQEQLQSGFFRIHHSFLINLKYIKEYQRNDGGYVLMTNNARLEVSQRKRKDFLEAVDHLII